MDHLSVSNKNKDKKYNDMQERLDKLYDEITDIEDAMEEVETRLYNIRQDKISEDNVYQFLLFFDKLYDNRQSGNRILVLDICEIPGVDVDDFRQCPARQMLCVPCGFYIGTESFKTGAIFNVRHIASPTYIVYFILCPWNVAICYISTFYNS